MADRQRFLKMPATGLVFPAGLAGRAGAEIVGQIYLPDTGKIDGCMIVDYANGLRSWANTLDWDVIAMCRSSDGSRFFIGEWGVVLRRDAKNGSHAERIGDRSLVPIKAGPLRTIEALNSGVYAAGMGRQVYFRDGDARWSLISAEIIDRKADYVTGFTTLLDTPEGILAAGYSGELFNLNGTKWSFVESPTNILINCGVVHNGTAYLCGVNGTILKGCGDNWSVLDVGAFENSIWAAVSFGGELLLGTSEGLFVLHDDTVEALKMDEYTGQLQCTYFSESDGKLWVFGDQVVSFTTDGNTWDRANFF